MKQTEVVKAAVEAAELLLGVQLMKKKIVSLKDLVGELEHLEAICGHKFCTEERGWDYKNGIFNVYHLYHGAGLVMEFGTSPRLIGISLQTVTFSSLSYSSYIRWVADNGCWRLWCAGSKGDSPEDEILRKPFGHLVDYYRMVPTLVKEIQASIFDNAGEYEMRMDYLCRHFELLSWKGNSELRAK